MLPHRDLAASQINAAVLAERERCARIADGCAVFGHNATLIKITAEIIANRIREGT